MYTGPHVKYPLLCQNLIELEFSRQIFEKFSNIKFHENFSVGTGFSTRAGKRDEAKSRFSQFRKRASKALIPLTIVLAENLTVAQLFKEFSTLKETRWFVTVFTRGDNLALCDKQKRKADTQTILI
jgi:hypothetical protein